MRLKLVLNAVDQAKTAVSLLLNQPKPYRAVPWFRTNQYPLKLKVAGVSPGFDDYLIQGDQTTDKFSEYHYKAGNLIGVDSLKRPADHLNARKLPEAGVSPNQ
ncbi:oxidoreductase C-terminal domain-containing protein [Spirosoma aerophilum]